MRYLNYLRLVSFIKFCSGETTETITDQDQKLLCMIHLIEDWFNLFHPARNERVQTNQISLNIFLLFYSN